MLYNSGASLLLQVYVFVPAVWPSDRTISSYPPSTSSGNQHELLVPSEQEEDNKAGNKPNKKKSKRSQGSAIAHTSESLGQLRNNGLIINSDSDVTTETAVLPSNCARGRGGAAAASAVASNVEGEVCIVHQSLRDLLEARHLVSLQDRTVLKAIRKHIKRQLRVAADK